MDTITIPVYSEQELTPRAMEVIRAVVDEAFGEGTIKFAPFPRGATRVLVFGKAPEGAWPGIEFVYTYSIAQIMTKANAATVLKTGIQQVINKPEPIPFEGIKYTFSAEQFVDNFLWDEPIVIDIETDGNLGKTHTPEEVDVISIAAYQPGRGAPMVLLSAVMGVDRRLPLTLPQIAELRENLPRFTKVIYHNGKFDTRVLNRILGVKLEVWADTMLMHHVLNIAAGDHKLKTLARRYLGAPEWEADLSKYTKGGGHYELIPFAALVQYNGWDVYWTYKLWEFLSPLIEASDDDQRAYMLELEAAKFLLEVEKYGIPFDMEYAEKLAGEQNQIMSDTKGQLSHITGILTFNPNSPQQVKRWLEEHYGPVAKTDEKTIQSILEDDTLPGNVKDFCEKLLKFRKASKIKGTYTDGWARASRAGRVHPTFLVHGTSTGRLSSTDPNAQNVPRDKKIRGIVRTHG